MIKKQVLCHSYLLMMITATDITIKYLINDYVNNVSYQTLTFRTLIKVYLFPNPRGAQGTKNN